ncbi:MAG: SIS domain-containing protein [Terriglobia bacterium]
MPIAGREIEKALHRLSLPPDWLFVGCGSSYYIALSAAASFTFLTGRRARALPASELLLFPDLVLAGMPACQPVLISRSGRTSEALAAAKYLEEKNIPTLAISCAPGQPLEKLSSATICLPPADEKSTVMTRSFTSMLVGLQVLAARVANRATFINALEKLPAGAQNALDELAPRLRAFVESHHFSDYVYLGQGPFYGLACEAALKVEEMSCSYAQAFHTLEFRHGPKSIVSPEVLVGFLLSESGREAEEKVLEEVKSLGGTTLVVTRQASKRVRESADFLVELQLEVEEYAGLAAHLLVAQLLGLYTGLKKGQDPDQPRHLSRVVLIQEGS